MSLSESGPCFDDALVPTTIIFTGTFGSSNRFSQTFFGLLLLEPSVQWSLAVYLSFDQNPEGRRLIKMGGRVKYKASARPGNIVPAGKLRTRQMQAREAPPTNSVFQIAPSNHPALNKASIAWLSVLSVIAIASAVLILWLLFRGKFRRHKATKRNASGHRYHPSLEIKDGRNEFDAWNRNTAWKGTVDSISSLAPLTAAAVKPAGVSQIDV